MESKERRYVCVLMPALAAKLHDCNTFRYHYGFHKSVHRRIEVSIRIDKNLKLRL